MKFILLLAALAMPAIAWLSQRQYFGPDNGTLSDRYPTLLVPAGYAFAIWGLIFSLDLAFAVWQLQQGKRYRSWLSGRLRLAVAAGYSLTAAWMIVFSQQWFWVALVVIWAALICLLSAAMVVSRNASSPVQFWLAALPLSLHAGWLTLAAFVDTAQVIVAHGLFSTQHMLPWSLVLWLAAGALLCWANVRLLGSLAYAGAAVWGLVGAYVGQSRSGLDGAQLSGWVALGLAVALAVQTAYLRWRRSDVLAGARLAQR